jgi:large subunit ribosomal protein L15
MRLNDAVPQAGSRRRKRRVGRGISAGQGASCGFGMRGQKSRSGRSTRPGFEGGQLPLYRRIPKLKHFPVINRQYFTIVNVDDLNGLEAGTKVTLDSLLDAGILTTDDGPLKVLGSGELSVKLEVEAAAFTTGAKAKIEAAGGSCHVVV